VFLKHYVFSFPFCIFLYRFVSSILPLSRWLQARDSTPNPLQWFFCRGGVSLHHQIVFCVRRMSFAKIVPIAKCRQEKGIGDIAEALWRPLFRFSTHIGGGIRIFRIDWSQAEQ
jgi:hypothetical protein